MCDGSERPLPDLGLRVEPSITRKHWDKVYLVIVEKVEDTKPECKARMWMHWAEPDRFSHTLK